MAEPPKGQSCATCRYALGGVRTTNLICHQLPPVRLMPTDRDGFSPLVNRAWWCGEYAPANPETIDDAAVTLARFVLLGDRTAARALADKLREE